MLLISVYTEWRSTQKYQKCAANKIEIKMLRHFQPQECCHTAPPEQIRHEGKLCFFTRAVSWIDHVCKVNRILPPPQFCPIWPFCGGNNALAIFIITLLNCNVEWSHQQNISCQLFLLWP